MFNLSKRREETKRKMEEKLKTDEAAVAVTLEQQVEADKQRRIDEAIKRFHAIQDDLQVTFVPVLHVLPGSVTGEFKVDSR